MKKAVLTAVLLSLIFTLPQSSHAQSGDSVCYANFDIDQNGISLTVADVVALLQLLTDSAAYNPDFPWYEADVTGDCIVDTADVRAIINNIVCAGMNPPPIVACGPVFPVATCCHPDITWVCCLFKRGNINGDSADAVNIVDLTYLVSHLFQSGPPPMCRDEGNVNGDSNGSINIVDVTFLVNHLFNGGIEPPECIVWPPWPHQN
ncbi:MAG: hypothetical protein AAB305_03940 [Candidatus Zixiibacteriota bacterium]